MGTTGIILSHQQAGFARRVLLPLIVTMSLIASQLALVGVAPASALSAGNSLEQFRNGAPGQPAVGWTNGNLGSTNSQYSEGEAIPFRREVTGLAGGGVYRVSINHDIVNSGLVAYDYLASWDRDWGADRGVSPLAGLDGFGELDDQKRFDIAADPRLGATPAFDPSSLAPQGQRQMSIWNGEILRIEDYRYSSGSAGVPYAATGTTTTTVDVYFRVDEGESKVLLAWGGHLARQVDWDESAGYKTAPRNTNGSPYHMRNTGVVAELVVPDDDSAVNTWDVAATSNVGNQDRSIKASAILVPGLNLSKGVVDQNSYDAGPGDSIIVEPGDEFTYRITVTNDGEQSSELTEITVDDAVPSIFRIDDVRIEGGTCEPPEGQDISCTVPILVGGASATIEIDVTVVLDLEADPLVGCGEHPNDARAESGTLSASDSFLVLVDGCDPDLEITKVAVGDDLGTDDQDRQTAQLGDAFAYELEVSNGDEATDAVDDVVVTDVVTSALTVEGVSTTEGTCDEPTPVEGGTLIRCEIGDLLPGDTVTVTIDVSVPVTPDSCAPQDNVATAAGTSRVGGDAVSADVDEPVTVSIEGCSTLVTGTKSVVGDDELSLAPDGQRSTSYVLTLTNDDEATLTARDVTIADTVATGLTIDEVTAMVGEDEIAQLCSVTGQLVSCGTGAVTIDLAPGETLTVTIDVTLDPSELTFSDGDLCGVLPNTATFTADGETLSTVPTHSASVEVIDCDAAVTFAKTLEGLEEGEDGTPIIDVTSTDTFTYVLRAENGDGATADATDVLIADEIPDVFEIVSVTPAEVEALDADGAPACTIDGNGVKCGYWDLGPDESAEVRIEVRLAGGTTEDGTAIRDASQCGLVENAASVLAASTTGPIDLTDEVEVEVVGCDADIDLIKTAVATLDADGLIVDEVVQLDAPDGPKQLLLVAGDTDVVQITYTFEVTNTGNVTLYDVDLTDPLLGGDVTLSSDELLPGESATATATYDVDRVLDADAGEVVNVATTTGTTDTEETVEATDDEVVEIVEVDPSISIVKTADVEVGDDGLQVIEIAAGDPGPFTITYDYVVTNDGTETLVDLTLVDDKLPEVDLSAELADAVAAMYPIATAEFGTPALPPGASVTVSADYTLTEADIAAGSVTNLAITSGAGGLSDRPVDDDDSVTVDIVEVLAIVSGLELVKEALVEVGDDGLKVVEADEDGNATVTYRFTITNLGNSTIDDLSLLDDKIGEITLPATSLGAGESLVVEADYAVTADDLDDGFVTNVGIVSGVDELGNTLTADDDERVELVQVLAEVVVEQLPRTGADSWLLLALASLMSALGAAVLLFTPNRRRAA